MSERTCRICDRPQCGGAYGWPCAEKREEIERQYNLQTYGTERPNLVRSYWD